MSGSHCLVLGCRNKQLINQTKSYYRFPRDPALCKLWVDFCGRPELYKKLDENGSEYLYKSSRVCSDHFKPTDFNNPSLYSQGLKRGSVPSICSPTELKEDNSNSPKVVHIRPRSLQGGGGLQQKQRNNNQVNVSLNKTLPAILQQFLPQKLQQQVPHKRPAPSPAATGNGNRSLLLSQHTPNKKPKLAQIAPKAPKNDFGYGINYVDMDDPNSSDCTDPMSGEKVDDEYSVYHNTSNITPKIASVASLSSSTPTSNGTDTTNDLSFKEKYEQTLKELFACRKIVKEQNHAIKQLQGEIDFLNQLLKEK